MKESGALHAAVAVALLVALTCVPTRAPAQDRTDLERRTGHGQVPAPGSPPTIPPGVALADGLNPKLPRAIVTALEALGPHAIAVEEGNALEFARERQPEAPQHVDQAALVIAHRDRVLDEAFRRRHAAVGVRHSARAARKGVAAFGSPGAHLAARRPSRANSKI